MCFVRDLCHIIQRDINDNSRLSYGVYPRLHWKKIPIQVSESHFIYQPGSLQLSPITLHREI